MVLRKRESKLQILRDATHFYKRKTVLVGYNMMESRDKKKNEKFKQTMATIAHKHVVQY